MINPFYWKKKKQSKKFKKIVILSALMQQIEHVELSKECNSIMVFIGTKRVTTAPVTRTRAVC